MRTEISRQRTEMSRVDALRDEMASGVRLLGSEGRTADEEIALAARLAGLPASVVARLRWKKIKRPFADVADRVRDAITAYERRQEAKARHDRQTICARLASLEAYAALGDRPGDQDFYRSQVAGVIEQARRLGLLDRPVAKGPADTPE